MIARARRATALTLALAILAGLCGPGVAAACTPRTSMTTMESQVMCATCGILLEIAQSPQADRERAFIGGLIARCESAPQIKSALVAQYGPAVLATPSSHGFGLVAYLVPVAAALAVVALLFVLLGRWRRRGAAAAAGAWSEPPDQPAASEAERERLDADLARFER